MHQPHNDWPHHPHQYNYNDRPPQRCSVWGTRTSHDLIGPTIHISTPQQVRSMSKWGSSTNDTCTHLQVSSKVIEHKV